MKPVAWLLAVLIAVVTSAVLPAFSAASAQPALLVQLVEDPFLCDAVVRPLGTVSGLVPGEAVIFSSPELNGVFSERTADASGRVEMRWNCDAPQTWTVTIRGLASGATTTFLVTGEAAPPPPDAPVGAAFDAKTAMTAAQMAVWKDFSPFDTVGVYIDVNDSWDNRADKIQSNLTASWVSTIFADGWKIIPIYVGFQAPDQCATARFEGLSTDVATARNQGLASAADAVDSVKRLGINPGNPIYYDMEAYRPGCTQAVIAFLDGWTEGVHAGGYLSGVYGSRSSTMWDLSRTLGQPGFDAPDAVWVSTGNGRADAYGLEVPADGQWTNARMHQYRLSITRTYGGVTREIDENIVNAPVARPVAAAAPVTSTTDSDGDGVAEPSPDNCDSVANPDQADQDGDGDGDVCDRDIDGDGVDNVMDFAPNDPTVQTAPTATTAPTTAPTAVPAAFVDADGDGIGEPSPDNCDSVANPDQADMNGDGDGDACDTDIDGDGVPNDLDQDPRDPFIGALPTPTPSAASVTEPTAVPAASSDQGQPTAIPLPDPLPTAGPTTEPLVVVLPTPLASAVAPTPVPTVGVEVVVDALTSPADQATTAPELPPAGSIELAAETVTIQVADESTLLPFGLAALGLFSMFCVGMGVRSWSRTRHLL